METSLRYSGDSKALRIHAKQRLFLESYNNTHLQVHGELDTRVGGATYVSALIRHFYPNASASLGVGVVYDKREKVRYVARAKKSFPVTNDNRMALTVKGGCETKVDHKDFNLNYTRRNTAAKGAAHLSCSFLNFQKDQDLRIKIGFQFLHQVPYIQFRENNWTLNADGNGKWNLRFDL